MEYRDPAVGTVLPQCADLFGAVADTLPDHRATFCPAAWGDLWHGDRAHPSEWGLATYTYRDLTVI